MKPDKTTVEALWSKYRDARTAPNSNPSQSRKIVLLRNQIAVINKGLVRKIALEMGAETFLEYDDRHQLGMLGMLRAIERFDPSRGFAFSSFAVPFIRGEIKHWLRDNGTTVKIPRRWREMHARGNRIEEQLTNELQRTPTDVEVAQELKVPIARWRVVRAGISNQNVVPLEDQAELALQDSAPGRKRASLSATWKHISEKLETLSQAEHKLLNAVYVQRRSRKQLARELHMDTTTLKVQLQQILDKIAASSALPVAE